MREIWKDIQGFEGLYQVSTFGRVKSLRSKKILKCDVSSIYERVSLKVNKKTTRFLVHRLVASTFIPNPNNYPYVNHKDENPRNNFIENLEWCTQKYNLNYGTRNKRISSKSNHVIQTELDGTFIAEYSSAVIASRLLNIDFSYIYKCCRNELPYAYGYCWKFASSLRQ